MDDKGHNSYNDPSIDKVMEKPDEESEINETSDGKQIKDHMEKPDFNRGVD
eukprot:CAMPEP_0116872466 /NCGR_PEP_ID=MMETSP0463-20121206/3222_1 /TAXON_ID=181622 /ORGANISM="Strombidinopsis sp, Strain SopsisLIS2011" /LENGTH=50 /DNA_ID=CAMNT_0004512727 /DNA_START=591 /DNA_END=743 /DNA_ORIENTATION=-